MVPVCPTIKILRDELRSVVHFDPFWKTVCERYSFQCCDDIDAADPRACIKGETLACVVLENYQHPETSIVKQLIGDKVHTPAIVPVQCCRADLPLDTGNTPTGRFLTHYQAFCTVEPVDPLMVNLPSFTLEQYVESPIAEGNTACSQFPQSQAKRELWICHASMTMCRARPVEHPKGPPFACPVQCLHLSDEFAAKGRPQSFFESTSWSICLSSVRSATRRFNRRFSSSSWRS